MRFSVLLAFLFMSSFVIAQSDPQEYKATHEGWLVKVDEAFAESQRTGKPIMASFDGSDWCTWCKRLSANVYEQPGFMEWANKNVVLLQLDFPRRTPIPEEIKRQNASLQQAFKVRGFPTVWVFDLERDEASGKMAISALGRTGYTKTLEEFTTGVDEMIARRDQAN